MRRYHEFREEDCCLICASHHAEIHYIYDRIIAQDIKFVGRPLSKYSWTQAEQLMDKLDRACGIWLTRVTPGMDPRLLDAVRRRKLHKR